MTVRDDLTTASLKTLLSIISLVIILPIIEYTESITLYITVCVFVLGKFVEVIQKCNHRQPVSYFCMYIVGILLGIIAISMCFYGFATIAEDNSLSSSFNYTLIAISAYYCFLDIADLLFCVARTIYTKHLLRHFANYK